MQVVINILAVAIFMAFALTISSLLLWWLVPLAFPALSFGFWNAVPLAAILLMFAAPSVAN